jgi:20S proteasome alpha/beta subunit
MTCIVGFAGKEKVYMGADSCGSNGHNYAIYKRPKLFKIKDRFIIGCTGTFRLKALTATAI